MSDKNCSLNVNSGNMLTSSTLQLSTPKATSNADVTACRSDCYSLISSPTLISSTFNSNNQSLITTGVQSIQGSDDNTSAAASNWNEITGRDVARGPIIAQLNLHLIPSEITIGSGDSNSIMNSSQISAISTDSMSEVSHGQATNTATSCQKSSSKKHPVGQNIVVKTCRFPKLEECAHFHYERVQLGPLTVTVSDDKSELLNNSIVSQSVTSDIPQQNFGNVLYQLTQQKQIFSPLHCWFIIKVSPHNCESFLLKRSFDNMRMFDEMLHRCVYERKISGLKNLSDMEFQTEEDVECTVVKYLERFSNIASDSVTCGTILTWLQLDNKGRRLPLADDNTMRSINTPAVGAAYGVRRYQAQASDEISIEVGDMISVIDMPSPAESIWWRGKKSHLQKSHYEVGFFPQSCVATIGDKVPRNFPMPAPLVGQLDVSPTKPVLRKHGKLIAFFRSFILSRPSRRRLKQSGIYKERVFSCDLSEHLLNSGQDIPMVLKCCAEFIEAYGIVDGIYRLSGITSNIQKLRSAFDEERIPDLGNPEMKQDIHAVSSLLKMYFRELPNPLCTYQLYDNFVEAIQEKSESNERLRLMKETVLKLPPPHYRTLKYLSEHLNKISQHHTRTGMTDKNLAIVWAPNLLRSPALESGGVAALRGVGVQAVVTEYLIRNCYNIFDALDDSNNRLSSIITPNAASNAPELGMDSLTDCESLLVEQREQDQSLLISERPKSLSTGGPKLISLEEAQERHSRLEVFDIKQSMPLNMISSNHANIGSYIEVGGGPSSLPDKYHTVISAPRSWQKRKTHSWRSIFTRNPRTVGNVGSLDIKTTHMPSDIESNGVHMTGSEVGYGISKSMVCNGGKLLQKNENRKSIENLEISRSYEEEVLKPMDICVRSNSVDSVRTTGHSRSVSHESYFDLLQSPNRGHVATCASRELSELGLNFDREEPEMRIFSESESLVSSPRVGKENIPPSTRRILRARPEEFSSQTNSVNPSPKKQPRLNILFSPSSASGPSTSSINSVAETNTNCHEDHQLLNDGSCCKRYKLEDQLSDIQYIDSGTPEHVNLNTQTLYSNANIQQISKSTNSLSKSTEKLQLLKALQSEKEFVSNSMATPIVESIGSRYSYPITQKTNSNIDKETRKERFSYPDGYMHSMESADPRNISRLSNAPAMKLSLQLPKTYSNYIDKQNRCFSHFNEGSNTDIPAINNQSNSLKLSITPSSPIISPRYSLLVGETSSECSSIAITPQCDMDPLKISSAVSNLSEISNISSMHHQQQQQHLLGIDANYCLNSSLESLKSNMNKTTDKRDMSAVKRELSLNLDAINLKMNIEALDGTNTHKQMIHSPSNHSNFTDNTSQSVTPSEFGYQNLQRQLSAHSLIETDDNSPTFEEYSNSASNTISPATSIQRQPVSPIKSTISITYNCKGIKTETTNPQISVKDDMNSKPLLETDLDDNSVYEQVKLFKNSVTEVNELLNQNQTKVMRELPKPSQRINNHGEQVDDKLFVFENDNKPIIPLKPLIKKNGTSTGNNDKLLYENMTFGKPESVYENILYEKLKSLPKDKDKDNMNTLMHSSDIEVASSPDTSEFADSFNNDKCQREGTYRRSPSNFSVKELATKFESSPVEQTNAFDFNVRHSMKKCSVSIPALSTNRLTVTDPKKNQNNPPTEQINKCRPTTNVKQKLNKSQQITRSLDENAFVREFGVKNILNLAGRGAHKLPEFNEILTNRRKSFDFTRPKTLNPPKRLPGMAIKEEIYIGNNKKPPMKLDLPKEKDNHNAEKNDNNAMEMKITPTTENRISLIQNNAVSEQSLTDVNNTKNNITTTNSSLKVLSGVKLDRERIDKIKEERRQQLTQKYRGEPFKSRSKTDLNSSNTEVDKFYSESLKLKSNSKDDVHNLQKDLENKKQFDSTIRPIGINIANSENNISERVRSIFDEKNRNLLSTNTISNMTSGKSDGKISGFSTKPAVAFQDGVEHERQHPKSTAQKFERKSFDFTNEIGVRERRLNTTESGKQFPSGARNSLSSTREKISPQFSIRDMTAIFESRSQNQ